MPTSLRTYILIIFLFVVQQCAFGQTTPPEWFTYPKDGEYVGVSIKGNDDYNSQEGEIKSAVISAFMSYFLQNAVNGVRFNQLIQSIKDGECITQNHHTELAYNTVIGYDLVRLEKDAEGHLWVAIKPITDQRSHNLGYFSCFIQQYAQVKEENDKSLCAFKYGVLCKYKSLSGDSIVLDMSCEEKHNNQEPDQFNQHILYQIKTKESRYHIGLEEGMQTLRHCSQPSALISQKVSTKGLGHIEPKTETSTDVGISYWLCNIKTLLNTDLYEEAHQSDAKLLVNTFNKKATKTHATFFHKNTCFMYNQ